LTPQSNRSPTRRGFVERRKGLVSGFLDPGGVARIVSLDARKLDPAWFFRQLNREALPEFARLGIDPCGENGEYHTLVTDTPAFATPLCVTPGERVLSNGYWAIDVVIETPHPPQRSLPR